MSRSGLPLNISKRAADTDFTNLQEKASLFGYQTEEFRISGGTKKVCIRILKRFASYLKATADDAADEDESTQLREILRSGNPHDPFSMFDPAYLCRGTW